MRMKRIFLTGFSLLLAQFMFLSLKGACGTRVSEAEMNLIWTRCDLGSYMTADLFKAAVTGYNRIDSIRKKNILVIVDFTRPSSAKRFYVIDMASKRLLFHCLVAHGKNTGEDMAGNFSNEQGSLKSSLGFYLTAETYYGKHGYSLRLDGLEKGFNDNARSREIVIHGADYVSQAYLARAGRLGRSWGCPALPVELSKSIIDSISGGSCLFIYGSDRAYLSGSALIKNAAGR
jgi:hypothetical protein